jgi:uncharacterized membrane protein
MARRRIVLWALLVPLAYAPALIARRPSGPFVAALAIASCVALGAALSLGRSRALEELARRLDPIAERLMLVGVVAFIALSTVAAVQRLARFEESPRLGLFAQCYWTQLHGLPFADSQESVDGTLVSHFGVHFSPTLLVLLPFFALWPSPIVLMVAQIVGVGLAPVPLYAMLRRRVTQGAALLFSLALLLVPVFAWSGYADFRDASFLPVLLLATAWAMDGRQWIWLGLFGLGALGMREDAGIALVALAAFALASRQGARLALILAVVGVAWHLLIPTFAMRAFRAPGLATDPRAFFAHAFGQWGPTPARALAGVLAHPAELVRALTRPEAGRYVYALLLPLLLLPPLFDWAALVALPGLAANLLAAPPVMRSTLQPYALVPLAFLALAVARAAARLAGRAPEVERPASALALGWIVLAGVLPATVWTAPGKEARAAPRRAAAALVRIVPPDARVYAPSALYPYLFNRETFDTWANAGRLAMSSTFRARYEYIVLWPAADPSGEPRDAALADALESDSLFVQRRGFAPFVVYRRR